MKRRILFVGHSDTRVVPLCAAIMEYLCINKGIDNLLFSSGGFWAIEGQPPVSDLLASAGEIGIDLSEHKAHYVTKEDLKTADVIVPQDCMITRGVSEVLGDDMEKVYRPMDVYDPSNMFIRAFRQSRTECMEFCEKLLKKLLADEKQREETAKNIVYRPAVLEDAESILELEKLCFSRPWTLENIRSEIEKDCGIFVGAFFENKMVGYASAYAVEYSAFMNNIGVHPGYRQLGIGEELMLQVEKQAVEKGAAVLSLEVRTKNTVAIEMYTKLGYEKCGFRRFFYHDPLDDAHVMNKKLIEIPENDGII